jgi:hypothetical protein
MKFIERLTTVLGLPAVYRSFQRLVGGNIYERHVGEYNQPQPGEKILDIGCGPGDRGRFWCGDVGFAAIEQERGTFHAVLATGVLHHLDDERAKKLFELARLALRSDGRLITYDGCFVPEQSRLARWVLQQDRGKFVREREAYERLAAACFPKVQSSVRHDLLRIPYTHLIMRCSN